jgi:hypothetical protein
MRRDFHRGLGEKVTSPPASCVSRPLRRGRGHPACFPRGLLASFLSALQPFGNGTSQRAFHTLPKNPAVERAASA